MSNAAAINATSVVRKAFTSTPTVNSAIVSHITKPQGSNIELIKDFNRSNKPIKFHFHEQVLFNLQPQVKVINKILLNNEKTKLIDSKQEESLQKSFNNYLLKFSDEELNLQVFNGSNYDLNKRLQQIYYPFLTKDQLQQFFNPRLRNLALLKKEIFEHHRLINESFNILKKIDESDSKMSFGILRSSYFPSLGIINYNQLLRFTNKRLFKNFTLENDSFSEILSDIDNYKNEIILKKYLNSKINKDTNNYFVINSPLKSEFFINLSNKLGINNLKIILITDKLYFQQGSNSNIEHLLYKTDQSLRIENYLEIDKIQNEILSKHLIVVKNLKELKKMIRVLNFDKTDQINSIHHLHKLTSLELDILGQIETKNPYRYGL
ncbi:hypothetical protein WICMUC_003292 [Wickerhamomyces mucosus]|uniref:Uncharacterized protein n=1 Tax=Wickerhamomyces mucosus TaxID=1378264 RepID=A0A9P8PMX7_9ASCO|nr:hypothetical protein WICMUC_003292 [Wickerhamomyces mucosus]